MTAADDAAARPEPLATDAAKRQIGELMQQAGISDRGYRCAYACQVIGRRIEKASELTVSEADRVIDALRAGVRLSPDTRRRLDAIAACGTYWAAKRPVGTLTPELLAAAATQLHAGRTKDPRQAFALVLGVDDSRKRQSRLGTARPSENGRTPRSRRRRSSRRAQARPDDDEPDLVELLSRAVRGSRSWGGA